MDLVPDSQGKKVDTKYGVGVVCGKHLVLYFLVFTVIDQPFRSILAKFTTPSMEKWISEFEMSDCSLVVFHHQTYMCNHLHNSIFHFLFHFHGFASCRPQTVKEQSSLSWHPSEQNWDCYFQTPISCINVNNWGKNEWHTKNGWHYPFSPSLFLFLKQRLHFMLSNKVVYFILLQHIIWTPDTVIW